MITLKKFMSEHPDQTLLGFAWSCYWRIQLAILVATIAFYLTITILAGILLFMIAPVL